MCRITNIISIMKHNTPTQTKEIEVGLLFSINQYMSLKYKNHPYMPEAMTHICSELTI